MRPGTNLQAKALPYRYYSIPVLLLLLVGLADTIYLAYLHYENYTNITFNSFCALSKAINCDTVAQSPWSILLGIPLAFWGVFAYLLYLVLFLATLHKTKNAKDLWFLLHLLGGVYSLDAVYFGYISAVKIKAYCILCIASYIISFLLFYYSWIILRRFTTDRFLLGFKKGLLYVFTKKTLIAAIFCLAVLFICFKIYLPPYWQYSFPSLSHPIANGLTKEGNPWLGADKPEITIEEYADYMCFQCSKMNIFLRRLVDEYPQKIKLIYHNYPMDHAFNPTVVPEPFHQGSGKMAMISIYAALKNKFWEVNDALYAIGRDKRPFNTRILAEMTGLPSGELAAATRNKQIRNILNNDILQGMKLGITGTPSFVINGKIYQGSIPAKILERIMR